MDRPRAVCYDETGITAKHNGKVPKMAQKLDSFPEGANSREGYSRYPWNDWLDGSAWELESGSDFTVTTKSFRSAAAQAARIRGGGIKTALIKRDTERDGEKITTENVVIQFVPKAEEHDDAEDMTDDESMVDA